MNLTEQLHQMKVQVEDIFPTWSATLGVGIYDHTGAGEAVHWIELRRQVLGSYCSCCNNETVDRFITVNSYKRNFTECLVELGERVKEYDTEQGDDNAIC